MRTSRATWCPSRRRAAPSARPLNPAPPALTAAFERQATATPDAIALVCGPETLSYAHLRERSARLARWLIEQGA
ncbi:AMP-binding protein, partial [Nocardia abscessus]|uniref:AMP-binding protein n=1 Tax=Nocardia abscessus TaxID=120957 RepID=UPI003CC7DFEC